MKTLENLLEKAFDLGIQLLIAVLVLIIGFKIIKIVEKNLKKENKLKKLDSSVKGFLISILSISLKILLFVVAASIIGIPTTSFISGLIGGLLGGLGGGLVFYGISNAVETSSLIANFFPKNLVDPVSIGLAAILGIGVFFINSVIASYNIGGTIEGMHDPKFKRIGTGALACAIASVVLGIFCVILTGGI